VWDDGGISVYFFPRNAIPADVTADQPQPTTWGTPMALFPSTQCNIAQFFFNHVIILDTTFCGVWAGGPTWNTSGCAASTGFASCADYVAASGASLQQDCELIISLPQDVSDPALRQTGR
jgi:hypothetical protein